MFISKPAMLSRVRDDSLKQKGSISPPFSSNLIISTFFSHLIGLSVVFVLKLAETIFKAYHELFKDRAVNPSSLSDTKAEVSNVEGDFLYLYYFRLNLDGFRHRLIKLINQMRNNYIKYERVCACL